MGIILPPETVPAPKAKRVWGAGLTIAFGIVIFIVYAIVQSLVAVFFLLDKFMANPQIDLFQLAQSIGNDGLLISVATIVSAIFGIGAIYLFIKLRRQFSFSDYLELKPLRGRVILLLCGLAFGLIIVSAIINVLSGVSGDSGFSVEAYQTSRWPWLFGLAVVIFAPAFEEAFFRGFLFVGLRGSRLGGIGAIILTSLAWAVLHLQYDIYGMLTILGLGIILGIVRLRTGSLWGSLVIHSFWNLLTFISVALFVSGILK